ncbi:MAG: hypothetical protein U5L96_16235 [Owenweeksia sp.]|nr:hypothetical protein [Owenweeksia sp.]
MTILLTLFQSCIDLNSDGSELTPTKWTNLGDPRRTDFKTFLEIRNHEDFKTYDYYESATKDSAPIFTYQLHFLPDIFLIDKRDTMPITEISQTRINNENIELYRFDFVNFMIHGDGCYIFSKQHGMLGTGRFSGTKLLLTEWGSKRVDFEKILEKQKRHHNRVDGPARTN